MNISKYLLLFIASLVMAAPLNAARALAAEEIVISGSTTVLPVMQKAAEAFMAVHPDISLVIAGGGSGNGIKALNEGLCQIAMASRDIKKSELETAAKNGVNPVRTTIAVDALAPVVNPDNPVNGLSTEDLRKIYAGQITNWKEVGGNDAPIVIISRDSSSGTFETWNELIMGGEKIAPKALLQASNGAVAQIVATNKNAIGYVGFGYLNAELKKLALNSIEATAETALNKTWPIARELYIFTDNAPTGAVQTLVDFLLAPDKGQKCVAETGFIPLPVK